MNVQIDDSVAHVDDPRKVGIVERRSGEMLTVRYPSLGNERDVIPRNNVRPLAELMKEARERGIKFRNDLSLTGGSTLAELVAAFGYSTEHRLRTDSLVKVVRQLVRAGLEIPIGESWTRGDKFSLELMETDSEPHNSYEADSPIPQRAYAISQRVDVTLPDPFWPTAMGLDPNREIAFLRSLTTSEPLLCLLILPDDPETIAWIQPTWEGLLSWSFRAAQWFNQERFVDRAVSDVQVGPAALLHTYLKPSILNSELPRLRDGQHCLNLISIKKESDSPVDFQRLKAVWPGPVFEFNAQETRAESTDLKVILECLFLTAGWPPEEVANNAKKLSPVKTFLWSREACAQILARASAKLGRKLSDAKHFRGSNEGATALALKAHLAEWTSKEYPDTPLGFEECDAVETGDSGEQYKVCRTDLIVKGKGRFEVETLIGSGPIERFYHQKVFSRFRKNGLPLSLMVPSDGILWLGPYLSDLAFHLEKSDGELLIPGAEGMCFRLKGKSLENQEVNNEVPWDEISASDGIEMVQSSEEPSLRLEDIAGYKGIVGDIRKRIILPEKLGRALRRTSRSSGILFFGPPGCGKSRMAKAIAGELEREVRLLVPSDLRGAYLGWGQIMIREQFEWLAEHERRMLIIDELDAVARSRREAGDMHSDEKADVNELLVQLDRVSLKGRLVVGTTNYVDSLDEAVIRSGRFGRFIPVAPPKVPEAVDILVYYLKRLASDGEDTKELNVSIPKDDDLRSIVEQVFEENSRDGCRFCGADLEEAVNETYLRRLQEVEVFSSNAPRPKDASPPTICIESSDLLISLREVRKSIDRDAMRRFNEDIKRYCGSNYAERCLK